MTKMMLAKPTIFFSISLIEGFVVLRYSCDICRKICKGFGFQV